MSSTTHLPYSPFFLQTAPAIGAARVAWQRELLNGDAAEQIGRLTDEDLADLDRWASDLEPSESARRPAAVGLREAFMPEGWKKEGPCRDRPDVDFFPERGGNSDAPRMVCAGCPVRAACLLAAFVNHEKFGIWGGTTELGRRVLRRQRRKILRPVGVIRSSGYRGDQPKAEWVLPTGPAPTFPARLVDKSKDTAAKKPTPPPQGGTTHCPKGHPYELAWRGSTSTQKWCRLCNRERARARAERERAERAVVVEVLQGDARTCPQGHRYEVEAGMPADFCRACVRQRTETRMAAYAPPVIVVIVPAAAEVMAAKVPKVKRVTVRRARSSNGTFRPLIDRWAKALEEGGQVVSAGASYLTPFDQWWGDRPVDDLTPEQIKEWFAAMVCAQSAKSYRRAALREFARWCIAQGLVPEGRFGWQAWSRLPTKPPPTACPAGHPYDAANVGGSRRVCKTCNRERSRAYKAARKAAARSAIAS